MKHGRREFALKLYVLDTSHCPTTLLGPATRARIIQMLKALLGGLAKTTEASDRFMAGMAICADVEGS